MCSTPSARTTARLLAEAVAYTMAPTCWQTLMAAWPTPPAAACTRTRSPFLMRATVTSAWCAVLYTDCVLAATWKEMQSGSLATLRAGALSRLAKHEASAVATRSPTCVFVLWVDG